MLDGIPRNSLDTLEPHELRLITLLTPLKILNPVKDDNKDFLKHMDKARESTIKNYSHRKANSKIMLVYFIIAGSWFVI